MTTPAPASSVALDHLAAVHAEWKAAQAEADRWQTLADQLKAALRVAVGTAHQATIAGVPVITNKPTGKFAEARFAADHPDLVLKYTITETVERLDVDALQREQPDLYTAYRGRRFERKA